MLANIIERPLDSVDERTKRLGLHSSKVSDIHTSLCEKGFIKIIIIDRKKLFELTEIGKDAAKANGIPIPSKQGRGGIEHDYWANQTLQFLRKHEFQPVCEVNDIDIVDAKAGIAIEVETGKSNLASNLSKLENSRVSRCFMLATSKAAEITIKRHSKDFPSIQVFFVKDFLKLTKEQLTP